MSGISDTQKMAIGSQIPSSIRIESIPGIGQKFRARILDYYQNEESAIDAIKLGAVGCVPGISFKQALRFAQAYFNLEEKITMQDVMQTPDILDIYHQIIAIIKGYAKTEYSKLKIMQYFPLPSSKISLIRKRQDYFKKSLDFTHKYHETLEDQQISQYCAQLDILKQAEDLPRINSRIILTDSKKVKELVEMEELQERTHFETIDLNKVTDFDRFFQKYTQNFDVVIYCGTQVQKIPDISNLIILSPQEVSISALVPEQIIRTFAYNKAVIQAMFKIVVILKGLRETNLISQFLAEFDLKKIKTLRQNTKIIDDSGEILKGIDPKLDNFREMNKDYFTYVSEVEQWINQQIQTEIGKRSINIEGKQILDLMRSDLDIEQIRNYIPPEVDTLIEESLQKGVEKLGDQLKLDKHDRDLLGELLPEVISYPIELNSVKADELEKKISARLNIHKYSSMVGIAEELNETYEFLLKLHQVLLEFDFFYTIGKFSVEYHLAIPTILEAEKGFYGKNMINLLLQKDSLLKTSSLFLKPKKSTKTAKIKSQKAIATPVLIPIPIAYQLGNVQRDHVEIQTLEPSTLSLLTGSNSGGKTMCILTCSQSLILAQMGFPSLGEFEFYPFNELYYFKKSSGQLSAGAFETTLLQFVSLAQSSETKIVFADELESITEPNAASKVLAGIFSLFLENENNYGVFVTHLAELLQKEIQADQKHLIRIDGIEAKGLDANLHLIVDRNPKFNFVAKSTPELILTRLSKSGDKQQQNFFQSILTKFSLPE